MIRAIIAPARPADAAALARIHAESLPEDFLPALGRTFLERVYYPAAIASKHAATLTAREHDRPVGFVTVASRSDAFTADVLRGRWLTIARYTLAASARDPRHVRRSAEVAYSVLFGRPDAVKAEIVFIAVAASHRGRGIGPLLVEAAVAHLRALGEPFCRTKTLETNAGVIRMYERMGWSVRNRLRLIGRTYCVLVSPRIAGHREHL